MSNFDWKFYIEIYDDLKNINNKKDAYEHYINFGKKEGRIATKEIYDNFDWKLYIDLYDDLEHINNKKDAFKHYINFGINEERIYNKDKYNNFDWKFYVEMYSLEYITNENNALKHYINNGIRYNNLYEKFDWKLYIDLYDDLEHINNKKDAFKHYINHGINEERVCNKDKYNNFDWKFYVDTYDDLKDINNENMAFKHYIYNGIKENRICNSNNLYENFDWEFYITLFDGLKTIDDAYNHWINRCNIKEQLNSTDPIETSLEINLPDLSNVVEEIDNQLILQDDSSMRTCSGEDWQESEEMYEKIISKKYNENLFEGGFSEIRSELREDDFDINKEQCLITFIIPTINRITLYRTIISLLNLKNKNWRAIIIFDGVKSNIKINDNRITIINIEKKGILSENNSAGLVRNIGFDYVSEESEWIGFIDDDDCISDDYIDNLNIEIELNNNIDVCIFRMIDTNNKVLPPKYNIGIHKCNVGISFTIRRNIINKVFFKNNKYEDYYFLKELEFKRYRIIISPYISYFIRSEPFDCTEIKKDLSRIMINF